MSFTFIDLFAGIGGFHAALKPLGGECVLFSEIDVDAAQIYKANWISGKRRLINTYRGDIKVFAGDRVVGVPDHDVLTGGFPCQPFSKSGNQLGVAEARGTLFENILNIIEKRRPSIVFLENVRNLVGPRHRDDYLVMIKLLRDYGYAVSTEPTIVSPHQLPVELGGSPQHRQRVFLGAVRVGKARAHRLDLLPPLVTSHELKKIAPSDWEIKSFLTSQGISVTADERRQARLTSEKLRALEIWQVFLDTYRSENQKNPPGLPLWTQYWQRPRAVRIPADTPEWKRQFIKKNRILYLQNQEWIDEWRSDFNLAELTPSNQKFEWQAGDTTRIDKCLIQFRPSGIRVKLPNYVPAFVAISQTPVLGWKGRELTPKEAAALQGFPEGFSFGDQAWSKSMKQIGNAVHPGVAAFVFKALVRRATMLEQPWALNLDKRVFDFSKDIDMSEGLFA